MGAVPKKKPSLTRSRQKHSAWEASAPTVKTVICPDCGAAALPHRVCKSCGKYRGRQVINKKTQVRSVTT
ncbi:50S ribosomal protein L32 [bacterium]|uniref:Large ribosomal subunit protein bL32 n=2 Tax=Katanobacteria TaxID=422282 RepID=A0A2M7X0C7_UNCKA|nr:50S ribosomal protein L32 [bacterium]PIP56301.1 MAG: 50S ribosomal protein L32 [candidate division WWE3 bacterium CG22_combo_CG10-13_8_21_14_all_39_12]PJA39508.1 MAG: 50S ribosomal protein L32 [candidate division WWE3 bacterium CG_4_9_14_3_um_filter_39_7]